MLLELLYRIHCGIIGVMFMVMSQEWVGGRFQDVGSVQEDMGQKNV